MAKVALRPALPKDAAVFVKVFELASHGLAPHLWRKLAKSGEDPLEMAQERLARRLQGSGPGDAWVAELAGQVAGAAISYLIQGAEEITADTDEEIRPLIDLENTAVGTRYLNAVAVFEGQRGLGIGTGLIEKIEMMPGPAGSSLIVEDSNPRAQALYERLGYSVVAARPRVPSAWMSDCREFRLMIKPKRSIS